MKENKRKALLHICCAPCSTQAINLLKINFDVYGYFYNPNLYPKAEHDKRRKEAIKFAKKNGLKLYYEKDYEKDIWREYIKGLENEKEGGLRCEKCYRLRMEKTAEKAKELNIPYFTTTLTISPQKDAEVINKIGSSVAEEWGVEYLSENFKKNDGFKKSVELSRKYGLYRQNYCGCEYSLKD